MPFITHSKSHLHEPIHVHFHLGETPALYLTNTTRIFAQSLVGIFIPIYIFTLTNKPTIYINPITNSITWVLLFYLVYALSILLLSTTLTNFIFGIINLKKSIFTSTTLLALMLVLLSYSSGFFLLLIPAAIVGGMQTYLYWIPYHTFFIRKFQSREGHYGERYGFRLFLARIANAAGPFIGGLFIVKYGFSALFMVGIIITILCALPILVSVNEHLHGKHNVIGILKTKLKNKNIRNETIAIAAEGVENTLYGIFWPILIFVTLASFTKVGYISSLSLFISSVVAIYVGRIIDKKGPKKIHKIGISINTILYTIRSLRLSPISVYAIDIVDRINSAFYAIPFNSQFYELAKRDTQDSNLVIYKEIIKWISVSLTMIICIGLISILPTWQLIFLVPAIVTPFTYLINKTTSS